MFRILAYGATHVGRERKNNEDAFRVSAETGLYLVCDGMGGHASGEIASQIAADGMVRFVSQDRHRPDAKWPAETPAGLPEEARVLEAAVRIANSEVFAAANANPLHKGMGTTVVGVLAGPQRLGLVHVGDSRIYRMREGELAQLTEDHSLLNFYIQTRPMSAEQIKQFAGKNVIVRAVGLRDAVEPDVQMQDYRAGDVYLLCSDGVTDMVDEAVIAATLQDGGSRLAETAERIIDHALAGGGKDNITVVLLQVVKVTDESRSRMAMRETIPSDTGEFGTADSVLEDTSPGFDVRGTDPSDAETLTEIEVRPMTVIRKHAKTQEVPYRPWQASELNAPVQPGVPLPFRRNLPPEVSESGDFPVDTTAATDPHGIPALQANLAAREAAHAHNLAREAQMRRAELGTTAKHPMPRPSGVAASDAVRAQQVVVQVDDEPVAIVNDGAATARARALAERARATTEELPAVELPAEASAAATAKTPRSTPAPGRTAAAEPATPRPDGVPYASVGVPAEDVTGAQVEDTERVTAAAKAAAARAAKQDAARAAEQRQAEAAAAAAEEGRKSVLKSTAVDRPHPLRASAPVPPSVSVPLGAPKATPKATPAAPVRVPATPPPAPDRMTTLDEHAAPEGLPLDDDDDEAF